MVGAEGGGGVRGWVDVWLGLSQGVVVLGVRLRGPRERLSQFRPKRKYFEHAGALLTADGTDDDLLKLEGTPPGYKLAIQ